MQRMLSKLSPSQRSNVIALACTVGTALLALLMRNVVAGVEYKRNCAEVKQNLHAIQLAVERYSVDDPDSSYPRDIKDVIRRGYLVEFPTNPFSGQPMRCVEQLDDVQKFDVEYVPAATQRGDFLYFRRFGRNGRQGADDAPEGYSLAAYL